MKTRFLQISLAIILSGALLSSCSKGTSTPNVYSSSQISFGVFSDNLSANLPTGITGGGVTVMGPVGVASITWTSGIANISGFKFEAKKKGVNIEISSTTLTKVDLFALTPALVSAIIDTGTYTEVELRIILAKSTTADLPLVVKGNYQTAGGTIIPVEFDFNDDATIAVSAENTIVDGTKDLTTKISMHLNKLLESITATQIDATVRTNNTILINKTINSGIYNQIIAGLTKCGGSNGFEKHEKSGK